MNNVSAATGLAARQARREPDTKTSTASSLGARASIDDVDEKRAPVTLHVAPSAADVAAQERAADLHELGATCAGLKTNFAFGRASDLTIGRLQHLMASPHLTSADFKPLSDVLAGFARSRDAVPGTPHFRVIVDIMGVVLSSKATLETKFQIWSPIGLRVRVSQALEPENATLSDARSVGYLRASIEALHDADSLLGEGYARHATGVHLKVLRLDGDNVLCSCAQPDSRLGARLPYARPTYSIAPAQLTPWDSGCVLG